MCPKIIFLLLFIYGCVYTIGRKCNNCIALQSCPAAESETIEKLQAAFCGIGTQDGKKFVKVCCSDFVNLNRRFGEDTTTTMTTTQEPDFDVEEHPNVALLPEDCGPINGNRIIGGDFASLYEFPWMANIFYRSRNGEKQKFEAKCGGSVISSRYILTAAHCIHNKINIAGVRIGEHDLRKKEDCEGEYPYRICENKVQDISIEKKIIHPKFRTHPFVQYDIALLRLRKTIDFSYKNARPVCLPVTESLINNNFGGRIGTVTGWGLTETEQASVILQKVDVPILTDEDCNRFYNKNTEDSMNNEWLDKKFCAGEEGKDSCNGDSGGPLILEEEYNNAYRLIQYGIVSYGPQKCGSAIPGVYTDVTKHLKWILDNIEA